MFIKIEVKDNNIEQALRVLKRKLQRDGFFKIIKLKKLKKILIYYHKAKYLLKPHTETINYLMI